MEKTTIYTTAPENYDYSYCESENTYYVFVRGDRKEFPIRRVTLPLESADYQGGRYMSGLHLALSEAALRNEMEYKYSSIKIVE